MAVEPDAGLRELEGPEDEVDHLLRGVRGGNRFHHLDRVPAVREVGAAEGIGEGLGPEEGRGLAAVGEGGPALRVHRGALPGRKAVDDVEEVRLDVGKLVGADHPFEDVEAAAPVGVEDVGVESAVGGETDWAAVAEGEGAAFAVLEVRLEGGFFRAVVDPDRRPHLCRHRLDRRSAHRVPLPGPVWDIILPLNWSLRGGGMGAWGSGPHGEPLAGLPPNAGKDARGPRKPCLRAVSGSRAVEMPAVPGRRAVEMAVPPWVGRAVVGSMPRSVC